MDRGERGHSLIQPRVEVTQSNFLRTYDPATGRYLETDLIGLRDGPNLFVYARGNPLRYIDRNGGAVDDLWGWGFPTEDEHFNRNRNNYCPKRPPKGCPGWDQDEGALGTKYRSDRGFECEYDQNGRLLPDITKWNWLGFQNYSFNYGAGRFPWTPRHVWQDFIPHFWYGDQFWFGDQSGRYPAAQTSTGDECDCPRP